MARRRADDPWGRVNADGTQDTPYAQGNGDLPDVEAAAGAPDPTMGDPSQEPDVTQPPEPTGMLGAMMGTPDPAAQDATAPPMADMPPNGDAGITSDQVSDADLASLQTPEDTALNDMDSALTDPNTSPDQRQQIQQAMALEARRRLIGQ